MIARYAERFNAVFANGEHAVTSPLGAWLLLALVAPAADGDAKARLEEVLGTSAEDAFARVSELLASPHPAVGLASGLWARRELLTTAYENFAASLPAAIARGSVPAQSELDAWARQHTLGLIEQFPVEITDDTVIVLADALATDVQWDVPFEVVPTSFSGRKWPSGVSKILRAPEEHEMFLAETDLAGDVAVHCARSAIGLAVVSVIADPAVPPPAVHIAAHDVAGLVLYRPKRARRRSLFDLPLGRGHSWTITETKTANSDATEVHSAALPAWEAENRYDLLSAAVGFDDAVSTLVEMVSPELPGRDGGAVQATRARYIARGFHAAAVTTMHAVGSSARRSNAAVRHAFVCFDRPYAVVAVALADGGAPGVPREAFRWHGIPVFSAWVAEHSEAGD